MGLGIIFAGCGGTFWTASPMLAAILKRVKPDLVAFVDPDFIEPKNLARQWVTAEPEQSKATLARRAVMGPQEHDAIAAIGRFPEVTENKDCWGQFDGMDLITVCNVDSNQARLDIRNWCRRRKGLSAQILSGCDRTYGQVYWGCWRDQDTILDWLTSHPDVQKETQPGDACGQNIMSNAQTGVFLGWALRDVVEGFHNGFVEGMEYYWKHDAGGAIKSWTDTLPVKEVANARR